MVRMPGRRPPPARPCFPRMVFGMAWSALPPPSPPFFGEGLSLHEIARVLGDTCAVEVAQFIVRQVLGLGAELQGAGDEHVQVELGAGAPVNGGRAAGRGGRQAALGAVGGRAGALGAALRALDPLRDLQEEAGRLFVARPRVRSHRGGGGRPGRLLPVRQVQDELGLRVVVRLVVAPQQLVQVGRRPHLVVAGVPVVGLEGALHGRVRLLQEALRAALRVLARVHLHVLRQRRRARARVELHLARVLVPVGPPLQVRRQAHRVPARVRQDGDGTLPTGLAL